MESHALPVKCKVGSLDVLPAVDLRPQLLYKAIHTCNIKYNNAHRAAAMAVQQSIRISTRRAHVSSKPAVAVLQTANGTDGRTPYRYPDPAPRTMRSA